VYLCFVQELDWDADCGSHGESSGGDSRVWVLRASVSNAINDQVCVGCSGSSPNFGELEDNYSSPTTELEYSANLVVLYDLRNFPRHRTVPVIFSRIWLETASCQHREL
jgi:hypothetical protein